MSKPKIFQKVLAASKLVSIPFVSQEMLTAVAGYLVTEEGITNLEAALEASENYSSVTTLQTLLTAAQNELATAKTNLQIAQTELATAKTDLQTAKTGLTTAQADAQKWEAEAIKFGAKPAAEKNPETPAADPTVDETAKLLAGLAHNKKADALFG